MLNLSGVTFCSYSLLEITSESCTLHHTVCAAHFSCSAVCLIDCSVCCHQLTHTQPYITVLQPTHSTLLMMTLAVCAACVPCVFALLNTECDWCLFVSPCWIVVTQSFLFCSAVVRSFYVVLYLCCVSSGFGLIQLQKYQRKKATTLFCRKLFPQVAVGVNWQNKLLLLFIVGLAVWHHIIVCDHYFD